MLNSLLEPTRDLGQRNLARWQDPALLKRAEMTPESAACAALSLAGVLYRWHPDDPLIVEIMQMSASDKRRFVLDACRNVEQRNTAPVERLLAVDYLDAEDIERIEYYLMSTDNLEAAIDFAVVIVDDFLSDDDELVRELSRLRQLVATSLKPLETRSDIMEVATRFVECQREVLLLEDGRPADWFSRWRMKDRMDDSE